MATIAENGLFPPFMENYLPAQTVDTILGSSSDTSLGFRLKVNPSIYNTLTDIKALHISIIGQSSYRSIFKQNTYTMGIFTYDLPSTWTDYTDKEILIPESAINQSEIRYNEYYKIQVRFCKKTLSQYIYEHSGATRVDYLTDEEVLSQSSEWSTVCLGRVIAPNNIELKANNILLVSSTGEVQPLQINSSNVTLTGKFIKNNFNNKQWVDPSDHTQGEIPIYPAESLSILNGNDDSEYLTSYRIILYADQAKTNLIYDSGNISANLRSSINEINYVIPYSFESNETIYIDFSYQTANLYEQNYFSSISAYYTYESWSDPGNPISELTGLDSVIGKVSILFSPKDTETPIPANTLSFTVRRSSDQTDFKVWDTLWVKNIDFQMDETHTVTFEDFTIESGTLYKYEISCKVIDDTTTPATETIYSIKESYIISIFDHAFLTGEGTQLCVKFNPNISSFKRNVSDNVVTTLGSKYPYFNRNGNMDYRSFSLSGTIAYEMDIQHTFSSRSSIYGDWIDIYGSYFVNHFYNQQNDRITQREFREKVLNYLYSDIPKLFRSTPEGNILVRISDVSLTPKNELGRLIYDFSCTATEIGEANIENYKLYKIQDFGES